MSWKHPFELSGGHKTCKGSVVLWISRGQSRGVDTYRHLQWHQTPVHGGLDQERWTQPQGCVERLAYSTWTTFCVAVWLPRAFHQEFSGMSCVNYDIHVGRQMWYESTERPKIFWNGDGVGMSYSSRHLTCFDFAGSPGCPWAHRGVCRKELSIALCWLPHSAFTG